MNNEENCTDCGHNHDHDDMEVMYLTLDDDSELECNVLGIFEVEDKEYIALLPIDEEEVLLYEYQELEDGDFDLHQIEDEDEFDLVSDAFYALFSEDEGDFDFDDFDDFEFDEDEDEDEDYDEE